MPYKFKCRECDEFVYISFLSQTNTVYKCQHCDTENEMSSEKAKYRNIEKII